MSYLNTFTNYLNPIAGVIEIVCTTIEVIDIVRSVHEKAKRHQFHCAMAGKQAEKLYSHIETYGFDMPDDVLNDCLRAYLRITQADIKNGKKQIEAIRNDRSNV